MKTHFRHTVLLFTALLLSACGQKGALFLPGTPSEVRTDVPSTNASTVPDEQADKDEDKDEQR